MKPRTQASKELPVDAEAVAPEDESEKLNGVFIAIQRVGDFHQQVTVTIKDGEVVLIEREQPNELPFVIEPARRALVKEALK